MVIPVSLAPKPEPVTVTELFTVPLVRLREMIGVMVNVALPELLGPDAVIVWGPEDEAGTEKV